MAARKKPVTLASLDRKIGQLDRKVDQKIRRLDQKFGRLDQKIDGVDRKVDDAVVLMGEKFEESKRFMRMLTEELRGEIHLLADKIVSVDEKFDRRVTRLEKHAGF